MSNKRKNSNGKKKKFPVFWVCFGVYVVILVALCAKFLSYTDKCLLEYEDAQPDKVAAAYIEDLKANIAIDNLPENMVFPEAMEPFETTQEFKDMYLENLKNASEFTYEKDVNSYMTEEPIYDILADGVEIAKVTWNATNPRTIFGILTIMDWELVSEVASLDVSTSDYTIRVPENYTVIVNSTTLSETYLTDYVYEDSEIEMLREYSDIPEIVEYEVTGLVNIPEILVFDETGAELDVSIGEDGLVEMGYYQSDEVPEEYYNDALTMAKTWDNFLTNDLSGELHGLATVKKCLIKDSYYWEIANAYAKGVDITFISNHTMTADPYENLSVSEYTRYSDTCYSCHIYFDKRMRLKDGQSMTNTINSTFYFVYYDDSDDGVDNPHWGIVDMVEK